MVNAMEIQFKMTVAWWLNFYLGCAALLVAIPFLPHPSPATVEKVIKHAVKLRLVK